MPNTMRWRYGDTNPVMLAVDSATVIEIGDLIYQETDDARPASALADLGSEALNQEGLHDKFVGVAMQASPAGTAGQIRVATSGVFEFDCAAAAFEVGALIGAKENTSGDALLNQTVKAAAALSSAFGRCARRVNPAGPRVLVQIESTVMRGGPQAAA